LVLASAQERLATGARLERRSIVGTAGDRAAVARVLWAGGPSGGRFEVELLAVHEVDEAGLCTALIFFDPDEGRTAQREAWARWAAIDPVAAPWVALLNALTDAWNAHDVAKVRACFADDVTVEDHRLAGLGRIEGADRYVDSFVALWDLAPDQRVEFGYSCAVDGHGVVFTLRRAGTLASGGAFENEYAWLALARAGRITRLGLFEIGKLDAALARFEELRPDPLRIPPNAVTPTWDRWWSAVAANDRDAIRSMYAPTYRFDDRRRLFRMSADLDQTLTGDLLFVEDGWKPVRTLLATAGDRLALQHILWITGDAGATSEIEMFMVSEVDREGRFVHGAAFDPDDRAGACRELNHRYLGITRPSALARLEALRAAGRDLARLRAAFPDDFFFHDHRRTGLGRLDGAEAYAASVGALHELAPDATVGQPLHYLADEPHGTLSIAHSFGTLADGGAFESVYVMIQLYGPAGLAGVELFELDDLAAAKARFTELRAASAS
jgi:ketosteroid isomerase-like protein